MLGSMFAGTDEAPGETEIFQGRKLTVVWSIAENVKKGSSDRYFRVLSMKQTNSFRRIEGRVAYKEAQQPMCLQLVVFALVWVTVGAANIKRTTR